MNMIRKLSALMAGVMACSVLAACNAAPGPDSDREFNSFQPESSTVTFEKDEDDAEAFTINTPATVLLMIRRMAATFGVELLSENTDEFDEEMCDYLADGVETASGALAMLYHVAVQALEMRERLKKIEGILGCDYDLDRLQALIKDNAEGGSDGRNQT